MAKFITTTGISHHIETIINKAQQEIYLVSPYLKISTNFEERLKDAAKKGINITIIYGKTELKSTENALLQKISNLQVFFLEKLHSKCYFNEKEMIITSMNMYEFSEKNNREMGLLIDCEKDKEVYHDAKNEVISIINHSKLKLKSEPVKLKRLPEKSKPHWHSDGETTFIPTIGYCISCATQIRFSNEKPYCDYCYEIVIENNIPVEGEKYCHRCKRKAEPNEITNKHAICKVCIAGTEKEKIIRFSQFLHH